MGNSTRIGKASPSGIKHDWDGYSAEGDVANIHRIGNIFDAHDISFLLLVIV